MRAFDTAIRAYLIDDDFRCPVMRNTFGSLPGNGACPELLRIEYHQTLAETIDVRGGGRWRMIRPIMNARRADLAAFWSKLVPFAPLFISCVAAVPASPIRVYAALYALLAAFQAAIRVINDHLQYAHRRRRQEDMWAALQSFMTIVALVAKDHESAERASLHRRLNRIAMATAQKAGMRGHRADPPRVGFYLLLRAHGEGAREPAQPAPPAPKNLEYYQQRGYLSGERPAASFVAGLSSYESHMVDLALGSDPGPMFDIGPEGETRYVASMTVPIRQDEITWGILRVESTEEKCFTPIDGVFLNLVATGLAQTLTLLNDDAETLLKYTELPDSATDRSDGGFDHE